MGWCSDPDMVTYGIYSDLAWDEYIGNKNLIEKVRYRYDQVSGWNLGASLAHIPTMALDYLFEATLAHSFGFFRSSIFCCATVLDLELKRSLVQHLPNKGAAIEKQTFGQSIRLAKDQDVKQQVLERLSRMDKVNKIRNNVSVHPCRADILVRHDEDNQLALSTNEDLKKFFHKDEIKVIQRELEAKGMNVEWMEQLSLKVIWETKDIIAHGPLEFSSGQGTVVRGQG